MKLCPKCSSSNVGLFSNAWFTTFGGYGFRIECRDCKFTPPKSKWQFGSTEKAIAVWDRYKRRVAV